MGVTPGFLLDRLGRRLRGRERGTRRESGVAAAFAAVDGSPLSDKVIQDDVVRLQRERFVEQLEVESDADF